MKKPAQPLAEVFGHLVTDTSDRANRYRNQRLCPFNNKVPNCTKDKAKSPLGVCSIQHDGRPAITCPVRFREDWLITDDAASFSTPVPGRIEDFMNMLQVKIDGELETPPTNMTIEKPF